MNNNNINTNGNNNAQANAAATGYAAQQPSNLQNRPNSNNMYGGSSNHASATSINSPALGKHSNTNVQQLYAASNYNMQTPSEGSLISKMHNNTTNGVGGNLQAQGNVSVPPGSANGGFHYPPNAGNMTAAAANNIGKIADYDPLTDGPRAMPSTGRSSTTLVYSSDQRGSAGAGNSVYPKRIGSVTDIDPANGIYGSLSSAEQAAQQKQQQYYHQVQMMQQQERQPSYEALQDKQSRSATALRIYRAIYDYEAQDVDEVSFREGDVIFEVESVDSGWMTGRVERTGKVGMLPANYVEEAVI